VSPAQAAQVGDRIVKRLGLRCVLKMPPLGSTEIAEEGEPEGVMWVHGGRGVMEGIHCSGQIGGVTVSVEP